MTSEPPVEKPRSLAYAWLALFLILAGLGWFKWKSESDRAACFLTTRNVQQSVRSFGGMIGIGADNVTPLDKGIIIGPGKSFETEPRCPCGDTYTWSPVHPLVGDLVIRCSRRKHQLDPAVTKGW